MRWPPWKRTRKKVPNAVLGPRASFLIALEDTTSAEPYLQFGIGCFHFGADPSAEIDVPRHPDEVEATLNEIPGISNVRISRPPMLMWLQGPGEPGLSEGGHPHPQLTNLRVEFRLTVSAADQQRLFPRPRPAEEPLIVNIEIRQGVERPIAFVIPRSSGDPAWLAVSTTWHMLREAFSNRDGPVVFDMLGPTPAPAHGYLVPTSETDSSLHPRRDFQYERVVESRGHIFGIFAYDPRAYRDITAAAEVLFDRLTPAAEMFYDVAAASLRQMNAWHSLNERKLSLLSLEAGTGALARARRVFIEGRTLRELAVAVAEFEDEAEREQAALSERRADLNEDESAETTFLHEEIDERIRTGFRHSTNRISNLIGVFERRRLASAQNRTALVAGVLAAALGAILGFSLADRTNTQPSTTIIRTVPSVAAPNASPPRTP